MTHIAIRRSPAYKLRRTVSEILELIDAVEHAAAMFLRKGKHAELARAREDFDALRRQVDELADIIANLDQPETADRVVEAAE